MPAVKIYSKRVCPYCVRAKELFRRFGIEFEEILMDGKPDAYAELKERTGWMTVPQIFIGEKFIGGYDELADLDRAGKLDALLRGDP